MLSLGEQIDLSNNANETKCVFRRKISFIIIFIIIIIELPLLLLSLSYNNFYRIKNKYIIKKYEIDNVSCFNKFI